MLLRWRKTEILLGNEQISARVADSFLKRALGFMFYNSKEKDAIIFKGGGCFWMLFVPQDIQMVAVKEGKVKKAITLKKNSLKTVCVDADYVIELANHPLVKPGTPVKVTKGLF